jgi:hypothetical protein
MRNLRVQTWLRELAIGSLLIAPYFIMGGHP